MVKVLLVKQPKPDKVCIERFIDEMNEDEQLMKRFGELARKAYSRDICLFTNFLSLFELNLFYNIFDSLNFLNAEMFGGALYCERKIIRFGNEESPYPISCILIQPVHKKFADKLSHRDFLGALINLGIKRETLGDIIISDNNAYVFCLNSITDFIIDNLNRVKHTVIKCSQTNLIPKDIVYNIAERTLNVASMRLDVIIGEVYKYSRSQSQQILRDKKVFVNGRLCENNSYIVKHDDTITVRGMGKFIFDTVLNNTKKGRYHVLIRIFI